MNVQIDQGGATAEPETLGDDILRGVKAIARFTGEPERRVHYLLEKGLLPAGQIGRLYAAPIGLGRRALGGSDDGTDTCS